MPDDSLPQAVMSDAASQGVQPIPARKGAKPVSGVTFKLIDPRSISFVASRRWQVPGFTVDLVRPQPFVMQGGQPLATICTPLGPLVGDVAVGSSRKSLQRCNDGDLGFIPESMPVEGAFHTVPPSMILIGVEDARLTTLTHELFDGRSGSFRYVHGLRPPNFVRLQPVLRGYLESGADWGPLYLESLLTLIAAEALREAWTETPALGERLSLPPAALRRVLDYIEENLAAELSLTDLAAVAGLSPYHFARGFRQDVGEPPHRYVLRRRVAMASGLLAKTNLPVADIAIRCGFSSASHFSTFFRKAFGTTPSRYRTDRK